MSKIRLERTIRCPSCKRNMRPWLLKIVPAFKNAKPPVPERNVVKCAAAGCGVKFYIVAEAVSASD